jgi:hypothetical protein
MAENMQVICLESEPEYFFIQGWTLICCVARRAQSPGSRRCRRGFPDAFCRYPSGIFHFDISVIIEMYIDVIFLFR